MFKDFKSFIARGNVLDLAIGVVIGAAFGRIVASFVEDILTPPLGLLLGRVDFTNLFVSLNGQHYDTLALAKAAGAPTVNYGNFLNTIFQFLIVTASIFLMVRQIHKSMEKKPEVAAGTPVLKECTYCISMIAVKATGCPN